MRSPAEEDRFGRRLSARPGFSLAELMIALAILGMGLLVIGAALPIGVRYTQQSVEIDTAAATAEYALDLVEQNLTLCYSTTVPGVTTPSNNPSEVVRSPVIFQPRHNYVRTSKGLAAVVGSGGSSASDGGSTGSSSSSSSSASDGSSSSGSTGGSSTGGTSSLAGVAAIYDPNDPGVFDPNWEPLIKVRPLVTTNVDMSSTASYGQQWRADTIEPRLGYYLSSFPAVNGLSASAKTTMEYDPSVTDNQGIVPALPCTAIVYPPIATRNPKAVGGRPPEYLPSNALASDGGWDRAITSLWEPNTPELNKLLDRKTVWTAFYRRVNYGPGSDPSLYEIIVVVSRRPSEKYRFPVQAPGGDYIREDTLAPVPWLVTFYSMLPPSNGFYANGDPNEGPTDRVMRFTILERPGYSVQVNDLLPVGSIFIPARNDGAPNALGAPPYVGLSPVAPNALPIYRVIERPDSRTVVVENNGFYPVVYTGPANYGTPNPAWQWPVWVIPPAFAKYDGAGNPQFEGESTILTVARRYVHIHEAQ